MLSSVPKTNPFYHAGCDHSVQETYTVDHEIRLYAYYILWNLVMFGTIPDLKKTAILITYAV